MPSIETNWDNLNTILHRTQIEKELKSILENYNENIKNMHFKKGIYVYGAPGTGKTRFIESVLHDLNYDIIRYDASDVRNKGLIDSITSNNISNCNVLDMMKQKKRKIAILMDEIDGMNNGDKGGVAALVKLIRQKKTKKQMLESTSNNPIICVGSYFVDKKVKEIMNVCNVFELKTPTNIQLMPLLKTMIPDKGRLYGDILRFVKGDLRKLNLIKRLYDHHPNSITPGYLKQTLQYKNSDEDTKDITTTLFSERKPIHSHSYYINDNNRTVVALLLHENMIDHLQVNKVGNIHGVYLKMLDNICYADYIDRITFQNQIWQFNEMSSLMKTYCVAKMYHDALINGVTRNEVTRNGENGLLENEAIVGNIRFTKVLTKYSTEYNNQLFIYNLCQELDMDKKDLFCFFQEMRLYFKIKSDDKLEQIEGIFEGINVSKLDIKRIFRFMDKVSKKDGIIYCLEDE